jgi:hypothetical protein
VDIVRRLRAVISGRYLVLAYIHIKKHSVFGQLIVRGTMNESGINLDFDLMDFDCSVFEEDALALFDRQQDGDIFYKLKSKAISETQV